MSTQSIKYSWLILFILWIVLPFTSLAKTEIIEDSYGNKFDSTYPAKRIISLYPAHTENLIELGLKSEIIGVKSTEFLSQLPDSRTFSHRDNLEKFIAAKPDLVLIRPMISRAYPKFVENLKNNGISVYSIQPRTTDEMFDYWYILGVLTGKTHESKIMTTTFKHSLTKIRKEVEKIPPNQKPRVFFQSIHKQMKTFAPNSMSIFCLVEAGGINVAADAKPRFNSNIANFGIERLLFSGENIDVFLAQKGKMNPINIDTITREPGFKAIKAVREKQIYLVDEKIVSRPTPRLILGIQTIFKILYPNRIVD